MRYIYVVQCNGFSKIGLAKDMAKRISGLQTGNPYALSVYVYYRLDSEKPRPETIESWLHDKFSGKSRGGEWFSLDESDLIEVCRWIEKLGGFKMPHFVTLPVRKKVEQIGASQEQT